ncbi:MAG: hypothetical protein JWN62_376 [Acidimicrobiales bacterium]|jgi:hypothetical protein|nr:hypothetical protein [Acidimicrobiales bacterium]
MGTVRPMSERSTNNVAKALAGLGGLLWVLALAGWGSLTSCNQKVGDFSCQRTINVADLRFAIVCTIAGALAITGAILIRRRLGGPLISPWQHW